MKRILYIFIAIWLLAVCNVDAQVVEGGLTRSGKVSNQNNQEYLTVSGKLASYPKLARSGEPLFYAPIVTTDSVTNITVVSATVYANILFNGWQETVLKQGFQICTNQNFPNESTMTVVVTPDNPYVECDQPCVTNVFSYNLVGLIANTTYYVRAYATNEEGTTYGDTLEIVMPINKNAATLPYFTNFSNTDNTDNPNWMLNNTQCLNYWTTGIDPVTQQSALFITTDGITPDYDDTARTSVMAERFLVMTNDDILTINFDVRIGGESTYDYLKVFLTPKDVVFNAQSAHNAQSGKDNSQYAMLFPNNKYYLNFYPTSAYSQQYARFTGQIANPAPGDTAKLVFLWRSDHSNSTPPGAVISNVEVLPFNLTTDSVTNITHNSAVVYSTMTAPNPQEVERGLCFGPMPGVSLDNENSQTIVLPEMSGSYAHTLEGLKYNTRYYVRAYAIYHGTTYYGDELTFTTAFPEFPAATLPYQTNFGDGDAWKRDYLIGVDYPIGDNKDNFWTFGLLTNQIDSAMYVSYGDGSIANYYKDRNSRISAERMLVMPGTDSVHISFDVYCGGEGNTSGSVWDWMKVLLMPINEEITETYYGSDNSTYAMNFTQYLDQTSVSGHPYVLSLTNDTLHIAVNMKNPTIQSGDTARLVFLWRNDGSVGTQPGPYVTKLSVIAENIDVYTDSINVYAGTNAQVYGHVKNPENLIIDKVGVCYSQHQNPTCADNFVIENGGSSNDFEFSITNLDNSTNYYGRIFVVMGDDTIYGNQIAFATQVVLPYFTDFSSENLEWTLVGNTTANYWTFGIPTGETESALFVTSSHDGEGCSYSINSAQSLTTATLNISMPESEYLHLEFDVKSGGECDWDFLSVFVSEPDVEYTYYNVKEPVEDIADMGGVDFSTYNTETACTDPIHPYQFCLSGDNFTHISVDVPNPNPNAMGKLVFVWRNDNSMGDYKGAMVTNVSLTEATTFTCGENLIIDDNSYTTKLYGSQCWMTENIREVAGSNTNTLSYTIPYYYVNDGEYYYNWSAANEVCPDGWHLPTDEEWATLQEYVSNYMEGGEYLYRCNPNSTNSIAKALASTTGWSTSEVTENCWPKNNPNDNNATGFSAIPAGWWRNSFNEVSTAAKFWSATPESNNSNYADCFLLDNNKAYVYIDSYIKDCGFSVRCVKDADGGNTTETCPSLDNFLNITGTNMVWTQITDYSADKVNPATSGYQLYAKGEGNYINHLYNIVKSEHNDLVNITTDGKLECYVDFSTLQDYADKQIGVIPFIGLSGCEDEIAYSEYIKFLTVPFICGTNLVDSRNNQTYQTVSVGNDCWMKENLRYNGATSTASAFPYGEDGEGMHFSTTSPYIYYPNGQSTYYSTHGYLYNWIAAINNATTTSEGMQGICPDGWHLPTYSEALALKNTLNNNAELKAEFLPHAGFVRDTHYYQEFGSSDWFWATRDTDNNVASLDLGPTSAGLVNGSATDFGRSVRCVKNN
jgi:uncharacterized protein (TIGR02145 family)